jgi:hypothetical protein
LLISGFYGYGVTLGLNGILDPSAAVQYPSKVEQKRVVHGSKSISYYFTIGPWGAVTRDNEVGVDYRLYDQKAVGDPVMVVVREGAFHLPYYSVH